MSNQIQSSYGQYFLDTIQSVMNFPRYALNQAYERCTALLDSTARDMRNPALLDSFDLHEITPISTKDALSRLSKTTDKLFGEFRDLEIKPNETVEVINGEDRILIQHGDSAVELSREIKVLDEHGVRSESKTSSFQTDGPFKITSHNNTMLLHDSRKTALSFFRHSNATAIKHPNADDLSDLFRSYDQIDLNGGVGPKIQKNIVELSRIAAQKLEILQRKQLSSTPNSPYFATRLAALNHQEIQCRTQLLEHYSDYSTLNTESLPDALNAIAQAEDSASSAEKAVKALYSGNLRTLHKLQVADTLPPLPFDNTHPLLKHEDTVQWDAQATQLLSDINKEQRQIKQLQEELTEVETLAAKNRLPANTLATYRQPLDEQIKAKNAKLADLKEKQTAQEIEDDFKADDLQALGYIDYLAPKIPSLKLDNLNHIRAILILFNQGLANQRASDANAEDNTSASSNLPDALRQFLAEIRQYAQLARLSDQRKYLPKEAFDAFLEQLASDPQQQITAQYLQQLSNLLPDLYIHPLMQNLVKVNRVETAFAKPMVPGPELDEVIFDALKLTTEQELAQIEAVSKHVELSKQHVALYQANLGHICSNRNLAVQSIFHGFSETVAQLVDGYFTHFLSAYDAKNSYVALLNSSPLIAESDQISKMQYELLDELAGHHATDGPSQKENYQNCQNGALIKHHPQIFKHLVDNISTFMRASLPDEADAVEAVCLTLQKCADQVEKDIIDMKNKGVDLLKLSTNYWSSPTYFEHNGEKTLLTEDSLVEALTDQLLKPLSIAERQIERCMQLLGFTLEAPETSPPRNEPHTELPENFKNSFNAFIGFLDNFRHKTPVALAEDEKKES